MIFNRIRSLFIDIFNATANAFKKGAAEVQTGVEDVVIKVTPAIMAQLQAAQAELLKKQQQAISNTAQTITDASTQAIGIVNNNLDAAGNYIQDKLNTAGGYVNMHVQNIMERMNSIATPVSQINQTTNPIHPNQPISPNPIINPDSAVNPSQPQPTSTTQDQVNNGTTTDQNDPTKV